MSRRDDPTDLPDISVTGVAADLGIPKERLTEPAVRRFVGLVARAMQLQLDFYHASDAALDAPPPPLHAAAGSPSVTVRYYVADNLLRVVMAVLQDGLAQWQRPLREDPGYLLEKARKALAPYELVVTAKPPARSRGTPDADERP